MYEVYVLKSIDINWYYVGMTKNKEKRITQHNNGYVQSTKPYKPFKLVFVKTFINRAEARNFEKYLKIRSNKEKLLRQLNLL